MAADGPTKNKVGQLFQVEALFSVASLNGHWSDLVWFGQAKKATENRKPVFRETFQPTSLVLFANTIQDEDDDDAE